MTDKDIQNYYETKEGKQVKKFIESDEQEAIVYSVANAFASHDVIIQCYSPVWKDIEIHLEFYHTKRYGIQRGDIVKLGRVKNVRGEFNYSIYENKTAEQIKDAGIQKILKDFDAAQKQNILLISEYQRLNNQK